MALKQKFESSVIPLSDYAEKTISEVLKDHGTEPQFIDWLNSIEKIEKINQLKLKNEETAGLLITKDIVQRGIIDPIEGMFIRLLTDGKQAIAARAFALAETGGSRVELEKVIEDLLSSMIKPTKKSMKEGMRRQRKGRKQVYTKEDLET